MFSIGVDSGSVATKAVLFNGIIVDSVLVPTGWSPKEASEEVVKKLLEKNKIEKTQIKSIIGTGYGRIAMPFADKSVTEITCHGKGAFFTNPNIRTILDIGGQDSKVIKLDEFGNVSDFTMNDKCAAGTGRFLQVMSTTLGIDISDLDSILSSEIKAQPITSMCTVFAESEVVSLLAKGVDKKSVLLGIINSIASRACSLMSRVDVEETIAFTGGVARSNVVRTSLEKQIGKNVLSFENSQFIGALGAAIIGFK